MADKRVNSDGLGVHGGDWPDIPAPIDRRDESRRFDIDGIRRWYFQDGQDGGGLYGKDFFSQAALDKIRRDLRNPKVTSK